MEGFGQELDNKLQYFQIVLQYLDSSGNLALIKAQCDKYRKTKGIVFTFKLLVNPLDLCEVDADLGNLLIREPVKATTLFQEVIYKVILVLELLPWQLSLSQVAVILRCSAVPYLPDGNVICCGRCLSRVYKMGTICHLVGIVTGLSAISKYTQSARYFCPDEDCDGYLGNHFIRVHVPGASEAETIRKDFKCTFCLSTLTEEKSSRALSEKVVAEVIPEEVMCNINSQSYERSRGQSVPVYIRDDLTKVVEIGDRYEIIGTVRRDIHDDRITLTIEANNIHKVKEQVSAKQLLHEIPRNVLKLYKDRKTSPWSFVLTLAYLFGGDICPPGSFYNLKLAILLSLVSQVQTKVKPLHILCIGGESETVARLLQYGQRFKNNSSTLMSGQSIGGRVTQDKYKAAVYSVEGGVLHLSKGGVCYVGDVQRLNKTTKQQLQSALSGGKMSTDVSSKFTGGLPQHLEQTLGSRVWGYVDPTYCKKTSQQSDDVFIASNTGDVPKTLLEAFSLLCFTDCGDHSTREETGLQMLEHSLVSAMLDNNTGTSLPLSTQDFHQFLKFASKLRPKWKKGIETLIHSYYLACRKSHNSDNVSVPVSAHQSLLSLAYCHSKLALRSEVTIHDALLAIKLYEESLTARFGYSVLSVPPMPHVTSALLDHCLGPENDKQMSLFEANVYRYCSMASGLEE